MIWIISLIILSFGLGAVFGAPWVPAFKQDFDELFKLAKVGPDCQFIDLGCGDGKVMLAAAQAGAEVTGYEINPIMWLIAWLRLLPYGQRAHVYLGSYWGQNLSKYDVIWLYLIDHQMDRMTKKLKSELKPNTRIISYIFKFPGIQALAKTRNSFVYRGSAFL